MSAVCNSCPMQSTCGLELDGKNCKRHRKELGYQPSHGDRIRDMSDEELAAWLYRDQDKDIAALNKAEISDWLSQPAEEGEGQC